jgi:hypothetical protein
MKYSRIFMITGSLLIAIACAAFAGRSLMEKKLFYIADGKISEAKFWRIHMGTFDMTLNRKVPGEGVQPVKASMNIALLSSGYVEGSGYSEKLGRVECMGYFFLKTASGTTKVDVDSIEFVVRDNGIKVKRSNGEEGDLIIDIEGTAQITPKVLELKYFAYYNKEEGTLREPKDVVIQGFANTKEAAQKILSRAQASATTPASTPAAPPAQ